MHRNLKQVIDRRLNGRLKSEFSSFSKIELFQENK